jgi:hypothetical protein
MTTLEYFKTLAMELRKRKLGEDKVADVLRELQSHLQDTGARPEEAFGGPKDYAARFPEGSTVAPGSKIGYLAAGVLIVLLGLLIVSGLVLGLSLGLGGTLVYMAMTLILTGVLIGWSNSRLKKLPELMTEELGQQR